MSSPNCPDKYAHRLQCRPIVEQAQVQNSNPTAQQPEVPQEPKPVSAENPTPPTQPPSIAEIDQQAAALWNQKRYSEAMPLFNQACSSGNADSCTRLGLMYDFGQGIVQDFSRAEAYYLKGIRQSERTVDN